MQIEIKVKQEMQAFRRFKGVTKLIKSCIGDNAEVIFQQGVDHYTTHGTLNQYFLSMAEAKDEFDGGENGRQWNSEITACIQQHAKEIAQELAVQVGWASRAPGSIQTSWGDGTCFEPNNVVPWNQRGKKMLYMVFNHVESY